MSRYRGALVRSLTCVLVLWVFAHPAQGFDFEWIGKIELDAEGLKDPAKDKRREAVAALGRYDISLTAPYLLAALRDPDPQVRAEAGRILGKHKVLEAVPIVIEWLNTPDPLLKQAATGILADLATDEAVAALIRSLGDPVEQVRQRAAIALGQVGTPEVVVPLIGRLEDDKSDVRRTAIEQLARIGDARAVIPLVGAFNDSNVEVRVAAVEAVGHLGDPAPVPALLRLLRDPAEEIKQAAVISLGNLHATAATDELIAELGQGSDSYQSKVAYALGRIASHGATGADSDRRAADRAVRALVEALADRSVRAAASEALRHAGPVAVPALVAHLDGELRGDLETAVALLRDIGDPGATEALVTELDRGRVPQELVLDALSQSGDRRALMPMLRLLSSDSADVRLAVMNALRPVIDDRRAADVVAGLLDDRELEIRVLAAEYLGLMRARSAVPRLLPLVEAGTEPRLRRAAVDALGEIADPRAQGALLALLESGPEGLHRSAADALIYMGQSREAGSAVAGAVERLLAIAADPESRAREHAVRALGGILRDRSEPQARAALEELARTQGRRLSVAAIEALGAMGDRGSAAVLRELTERDSHRRRAAVTALGNLGDRAATPVVLEALQASDDRVSGDAAWALAKLADPRALDPLVHATRRRGWATAINASAALARYAPAAYTDALVRLLYHRSRLVRANAAAGLARLWAGHGAQVPAKARRALAVTVRKDVSWLVRAASARALRRLGDAGDVLAQARAVERDERVREAMDEDLGAAPERTDWRSFYFVDPDRDDAPVRQEPYFLVASDGLATALYTDARGVATEERFPPGAYILAPRSKAVRY